MMGSAGGLGGRGRRDLVLRLQKNIMVWTKIVNEARARIINRRKGKSWRLAIK